MGVKCRIDKTIAMERVGENDLMAGLGRNSQRFLCSWVKDAYIHCGGTGIDWDDGNGDWIRS